MCFEFYTYPKIGSYSCQYSAVFTSYWWNEIQEVSLKTYNFHKTDKTHVFPVLKVIWTFIILLNHLTASKCCIIVNHFLLFVVFFSFHCAAAIIKASRFSSSFGALIQVSVKLFYPHPSFILSCHTIFNLLRHMIDLRRSQHHMD